MSSMFDLKIIVPDGIVLEESGVSNLIAVGTEGELEILAGHTDFLTTLRISRLEIQKKGRFGKMKKQWAVAGGILQVNREGVTVITTAAEPASAIDLDRAEAARRRARSRLKERGDDLDLKRADQALARAEVRIRVSSFKQEGSWE